MKIVYNIENMAKKIIKKVKSVAKKASSAVEIPKCVDCKGTGRHLPEQTCPTCNGTGK